MSIPCASVVLLLLLMVVAGAVDINASSTVTIRDSALLSNYVKDYDNLADGGACYVKGTSAARLVLVNTTVHNNSAQNVGGGIAVGSKE